MRKILKTVFAIAFILGMTSQTNAQKMNKVPTVKLNNGVEMPQLGFAHFICRRKHVRRMWQMPSDWDSA